MLFCINVFLNAVVYFISVDRLLPLPNLLIRVALIDCKRMKNYEKQQQTKALESIYKLVSEC